MVPFLMGRGRTLRRAVRGSANSTSVASVSRPRAEIGDVGRYVDRRLFRGRAAADPRATSEKLVMSDKVGPSVS